MIVLGKNPLIQLEEHWKLVESRSDGTELLLQENL